MEKGRLLQNKNMNKAIQVSKITLIINLSLSLLKFAAGYIEKSSAMLSDAVHSASDVLSTIVVMVGIKISENSLIENILMGMNVWNVWLPLFSLLHWL